jgi:hypothetical protein
MAKVEGCNRCARLNLYRYRCNSNQNVVCTNVLKYSTPVQYVILDVQQK